MQSQKRVRTNLIGGRLNAKSTFAIAALAITISHLFVFWMDTSKYVLTSDAFVPDALKDSIIKSGSLIPREFAFANGDFLTYYYHTYSILLSPLISSYNQLHNISALIHGLVFLFVMFELCRHLGASFTRSLLITSFFASGISLPITDWFFGQGGYASTLTLVMVMLIGLKKVLFIEQPFTIQSFALFIIPACLIFLLNPARFATQIAIPLLVSLYILDKSQSLYKLETLFYNMRTLKFVLVFGLPTLIIRVYFELTSSQAYGITSTGFRGVSEISQGFFNTFGGISVLFQLLPYSGTPLLSLTGILYAGKIALCLLFIWFVKMQVSKRKEYSFKKLILIYGLTGFYVHVAILLVTNISIDLSSGRYLLNSLTLLIIYCLSEMKYDKTSWFAFPSWLLAGLIVISTISIHNNLNPSRSRYESIHHLTQFMKLKGINEANATYWNSAYGEYVSDKQVEFNTVYLEGNSCLSEYWWVNDRKSLEADLALLVTRQEFEFLNATEACKYIVAKKSVVKESGNLLLLN